MTREALAEVLRLHRLWLESNPDGKRANLQGADLRDANLQRANLQCANLQGAYLQGADIQGAYLQGDLKIKTLRVLDGLYPYTIYAFVTESGESWVRMGCLWNSVEEWGKIGIRESNLGEFPNDGSPKCEQRVRAFEYARNEALIMASECRDKA